MKIKVGFDAIKFDQAALGEAPEGFDAVDVCAAPSEGFALIDADVLVVADIDQAIITGPAIGADDALRVDPPANDGPQSLGGAIPEDFRIDFPVAFKDAEDWLLERAPAAQTRQGSASHPAGSKVTFINFHHPPELAPILHALQSNRQPKTLVKRIDRLAIELQQSSRLRCGQIQTKALQNFLDAIA